MVFVNIVGIGGLGFVSFPEDVLFFDDLFETIDWMYDNRRYSKVSIVFVVL